MSRLVSEVVCRPRITNVFAAGRFVKKKGFDFLLKAIPEVLAGDRRIRFQIAGDGHEFDKLKMLQTELKLEGKVQFLGFRIDVPQLMKQSQLFVMPSLSESFGIILLEAMAKLLFLLIKRAQTSWRVGIWKQSTIQKLLLNVRKTHWNYSKTTTHPMQSYQKFCLYTRLFRKIA